jgi:hypothetical protein
VYCQEGFDAGRARLMGRMAASEGAMDLITGPPTAPGQPWDALVSTSQAVHDHLPNICAHPAV